MFCANDVKRIPRVTINPPTTAVRRVDFFLQNRNTAGEIASDTKNDVAAKHPVIDKSRHNVNSKIL